MPHEAIVRAVAERAPAMLAFLATVVNMDSPTEDKPLADLVGDVFQAKAESLGLTCVRDVQTEYADNRICRIAPKSDAAALKVLMVGHYDTVYAAGTVAERPFTVQGERATGPGAFDMKGGLTIGLFAIEACQAALGDVPVAITFIFNSDEEIGSPKSREVILKETVQHDLALVLEPGRPGPAITIRRKGVGIFRMTILGNEAHAGAEPENGVNSIVEAAHKILAIQALNDWDAGTIVTPGVVHGGTKPYVVPGRTDLEIDSRVATLAERDRIVAAMNAIAAQSTVPGTTATLTGGFHRPPMEASETALAHVARMREIAGEVGYPLGAASTGGASDGNLTADAGTPTIDGLGVQGGRAHSPEEWIDIASLEAKCRVLACFLADLAERPVRGAGS